MITAFELIFTPLRAWNKINAAQGSVVRVLLLFLLPFLLFCVGIEGLALWKWGERRGEVDYVVKISQDLAIRYSAAQMGMLMTSIFCGAKALQWITQSFQVATSDRQCATLMAYGFSPIILLRLADAWPAMNTWVAWMIGAFLSVSVLYHGVALILKPEQTKGFGLYLISVIIVLLSSGLSHFVAVSVLHGKVLQ